MDGFVPKQRPMTSGTAVPGEAPAPNSGHPIRRSIAPSSALSATFALTLALTGALADPGPEGNPPPQWVKGSFIGSAFVLSFLPETTDWVAVEWSDNAIAWQELVHVAATSTSTVYADLEARPLPYRAYRLRSPGTRSEDAARAWSTQPRGNYRFHLDRISSVAPFLMQANIEVRDGEKILTEVIADGLPLGDGDPEYFPNVEELFARLEQARTDGARQVWVTYAAPLGYPARCTLDLRGLETGSVDGGALVQYRVSNLLRIAE